MDAFNKLRRLKILIDPFLSLKRGWEWIDLWFIIAVFFLFLIPVTVYIIWANGSNGFNCFLCDFFIIYLCGVSLLCGGISHIRYYIILLQTDPWSINWLRRYRKLFLVIGILIFTGAVAVIAIGFVILSRLIQ